MSKSYHITKKDDFTDTLESLRVGDISFSATSSAIWKNKPFIVVCMESDTVKNWSDWGFSNTDFSVTSSDGFPAVSDPKNMTEEEFTAVKNWQE